MRKGFVQAIEGIIAAMVLLTYLASLSIPPAQDNNWGENMLKRAGSEYLESFDRANLSWVVFEGRDSTLTGVNRFFFPGVRVSIVPETLPKSVIRVGVLSNYSMDPIVRFTAAPTPQASCDASGWITESFCIINNSAYPFNKRVVLADTDAGTYNGRLDYDAVYIDFNDNGAYDMDEGPFVENSIFKLGDDYYAVASISNASRSVVFWNASRIVEFNSNVRQISINGRNVTFTFYGADPSRLSQFDALIISESINILPYEVDLRNFLQQGGGIVEIANMTNANFNSVQKSMFGIDNVSYVVLGTGNTATFNRDITLRDPVGVKDYFAGAVMKTYTLLNDTTGYDVDMLPSPESVHLGTFNVSGKTLTVALDNATSVYDRMYIDSDGDKNFSKPPSDSIGYSAGEYINISQNIYLVRQIDPAGVYSEMRSPDNYTFLDIHNPTNIAAYGGAKVLLLGDNYYSISTNNIGDSFTILTPVPVCAPLPCDSSTLPSGEHKYGQLVPGISKIPVSMLPGNRKIAVTNVSSGYNLLNLDIDDDGRFDGANEGPFVSGEIIPIGPEYYRILVNPNGNNVDFMLRERQKVPASVASYLYAGRTVWMPDITADDQDAWNYIVAAMLWASDKNAPPESMRAGRESVSVKRVFISSGDMYLPYGIDARFSHWG